MYKDFIKHFYLIIPISVVCSFISIPAFALVFTFNRWIVRFLKIDN
ncbi:hypothetical protein DB42_BL00420 [Neochlamydia sp. EPS4]|nr:hypothetical protein DB42_BL00420 [Neochlamydia sp. EPS4]KIC75890.1 hypothetical protein DB41_GZ00540 [Neochlamydia sp. TUME1]